MNIEAYDSESLRKIVRELQNKNRQLKEKLYKANIPFDTENPFEELISNHEEYDPDKASNSINMKSFHYYDRMYPSQEVASSIGNLVKWLLILFPVTI
ncbi:hypothetical protein [Hespellia stercorisuis]|uniref:Uncharacterized protein n=1 Tax=Hespellia stercorisuis DSM 15480 TaxID=1121950 RepID=A0A1M6WEL5_9FIRM|nr:hypothetical protein [Hespellia stercorisuis]SHK92243.1 hypothetical protein SAMN02745243_04004 [Hespellia stercorisuis DSM 15480]